MKIMRNVFQKNVISHYCGSYQVVQSELKRKNAISDLKSDDEKKKV